MVNLSQTEIGGRFFGGVSKERHMDSQPHTETDGVITIDRGLSVMPDE